LRFYGVDLFDLFRGRLSYRRVWSLMQRLPQESWTQTILRDRPVTEPLPARSGPLRFGPWSQSDYLRASQIDALRRLEYVLRRVNGDDRFPFPDPVPRPGMDRPVRRQTDAAVTYLKGLRAKGA